MEWQGDVFVKCFHRANQSLSSTQSNATTFKTTDLRGDGYKEPMEQAVMSQDIYLSLYLASPFGGKVTDDMASCSAGSVKGAFIIAPREQLPLPLPCKAIL